MNHLIAIFTLSHHGDGVNRLTMEPRAGLCSGTMTHSSDPPSPRDREEAARREALATLESLSERDTVASSALARTARRATDHFAGKDAVGTDGAVDRIELWGRRIGRTLSLAGLVALAIYLYVTYFAR